MNGAERYRQEIEAIFQELEVKARLHELHSPRAEFRAQLLSRSAVQGLLKRGGATQEELNAMIENILSKRFPIDPLGTSRQS